MRANVAQAFADIDQTITPGFTLFPVCEALTSEGIIARSEGQRIQDVHDAFVAEGTDYGKFVLQALEFAAMALKGQKASRVRLIAGMCLPQVLSLYPWVSPTFTDLQRDGGKLTIVSAEPDFVTQPIADLFGADYLSTDLEINSDGNYTGQVASALSSSVKGQLVEQILAKAPTPLVYVFGDSAGDIGMLDHATPIRNAYCIKPDSVLREHAQSSGMTIVENPELDRSLLL